MKFKEIGSIPLHHTFIGGDPLKDNYSKYEIARLMESLGLIKLFYTKEQVYLPMEDRYRVKGWEFYYTRKGEQLRFEPIDISSLKPLPSVFRRLLNKLTGKG